MGGSISEIAIKVDSVTKIYAGRVILDAIKLDVRQGETLVILGGSGSLIGSFVGSFVVGFLYNFGQAMLPELAYVVLFLPMLVVLVLRPQGLFGRAAP